MSDILVPQPITFESKELINSYFKQKCTLSSEFTFTNLFMWQKSYNMHFATPEGLLTIIPQHGNGPLSATYPVGDGDVKAAVRKILDYFEHVGEPPLLRLYNDISRYQLETEFPDTFIFTEDVNSHDYVYRTSDLINLSGNKYHGKRNHVNRFKSTYNYEYHRMTPDYKDKCMEMFKGWVDSKKDSVPGIDEQFDAVSTLLENWEKLDITGGCLTVDGEMVAFSFGEQLCADGSMAVIHLEHANTDYTGSFAAMNQQFLEHEWSSFEFVNREEDMGLEGLRRAKESYKPCFMVKKYVATLK